MSRKEWTDEKLFFRLLNNKSNKTYWKNIMALHFRPNKYVFDKCVELTKSKSPKERAIGIDVLSQLGTCKRPYQKATIKLYFDLLKCETDVNALGSLLYAIGHNAKSLNITQIKQLTKFSKHRSAWVRQGLTYAIGAIDNPTSIDCLIELSKDHITTIRDWATFGLGTLIESDDPNIRRALWERVNDIDQNTRFEAIVGLAIRKDSLVKEIIQRELEKSDCGSQIFDAIIELNEKDFLPFLEKELQKSKKDDNINPEWIEKLDDCINELENNDDYPF